MDPEAVNMPCVRRSCQRMLVGAGRLSHLTPRRHVLMADLHLVSKSPQ